MHGKPIKIFTFLPCLGRSFFGSLFLSSKEVVPLFSVLSSFQIKNVFYIIFTEEWLWLQRNCRLTPWPQHLCIKNNAPPVNDMHQIVWPFLFCLHEKPWPSPCLHQPSPPLIFDRSLRIHHVLRKLPLLASRTSEIQSFFASPIALFARFLILIPRD